MSGYYNTPRFAEQPGKKGSSDKPQKKESKVREFPKGGLGSGYAEQAAEAIRGYKKRQKKQLEELGY